MSDMQGMVPGQRRFASGVSHVHGAGEHLYMHEMREDLDAPPRRSPEALLQMQQSVLEPHEDGRPLQEEDLTWPQEGGGSW